MRRLFSRQRGLTLFIALVALVVMALAGVALVHAVDTTNLIAGNMAFRDAALSATDAGVEQAFSALPGILSASAEQNDPPHYFATLQPVDSAGVPTTISWGSVPCTDLSGNTISCGDDSSYRVQYVVDRMCQGPLPVTDIQDNCVSDPSHMNGSKKSGAPVYSNANAVYYRVTVKTTGPRGTVSMAQAIISM